MAFIPSMWTAMFVEAAPDESLDILGEQGWRAVEVSTEHADMMREDEALVEPFAAAAEKHQIALDQMHAYIAADVASLDDARREHDMEAVIGDLKSCARLGIPVAVIHPGGHGEISTYEELQQVNHQRLESFARLAAVCADVGVKLAVENVADRPPGSQGRRRYGAMLEEVLQLCEEVALELLGVCLDTSHANIQGLDLPETIKLCGDKLWALHISDNHGTGDDHLIPGYGEIEWGPVVAALREIGYERPFNLEVPGARRGDASLMALRSQHALEVCEQLLGED